MTPELMETRLLYLEKVVDKILPHTMSTKNKKDTTETAPATPVQPPVVAAVDKSTADSGTIRLALPKYRVPYGDDLVMVDATMLKSNPELLAYMRLHHPTCFIN